MRVYKIFPYSYENLMWYFFYLRLVPVIFYIDSTQALPEMCLHILYMSLRYFLWILGLRTCTIEG